MMNKLISLLVVLAPVGQTLLQAGESIPHFAHSGEKIAVTIGHGKDPEIDTVVLRLHERPFTQGAAVRVCVDNSGASAVKTWVAEIAVPTVRVPVVFQVTPEDDARRILGEMVVYPDRALPWDKSQSILVAGAPQWFGQWARATQLSSVSFLTAQGIESLRRGDYRMPDSKETVLVIGDHGKTKLSETEEIARRYSLNILVLDSISGKESRQEQRCTTVSPKEMQESLSPIRSQQWPAPLVFSGSVVPRKEIMNRQAWIMGDVYPLVEVVLPVFEEDRKVASNRKGIVFSYLPWQEQLGRSELADLTLLDILSKTARGTGQRLSLESIFLWVASPGEKPDLAERPVLAAAMSQSLSLGHDVTPQSAPERRKGSPCVLMVLDLRGTRKMDRQLLDACKSIERNGRADSPSLLVLGDDPMLDQWKWLGIDREKRQCRAPGAIWWPDDTLPPSPEAQIRLMQLFTRHNICLKATSEN